MKLKDGVSVLGAKPELVIAMMAAERIWNDMGQVMVVTSVTDGKHTHHSRHYIGCAFDVRTRYFSEEQKQEAYSRLKASLGNEFNVLLESTHIHVSFKP